MSGGGGGGRAHARFQGATVVITGGGGSIGSEIARGMAAEGAGIVVLDWNEAAAVAVADEIMESGGRALAVRADISDAPDVARAMERAAAWSGGIDVLVNNAAIAESEGVLETSIDSWRRDISVTLDGAFLCSKAVLAGMIARGNGVIVNVASVNAFSAIDGEAYSAAKAGLVSLTQMMAAKHGPDGIRVVGVAPGAVRTNHPAWVAKLEKDPTIFEDLARWYPLGRVGEPVDVANAVMFLASDDARWISGTTLVVDGGLLAGNTEMMRRILGS